MIDDDDYIPFEGPLHKNRGPRKMSPAEIEHLQETLRKIRERRAARQSES